MLEERRIKREKEFIEKSCILHNNFYDYSLVYYINNKTKVKIVCPVHGIFEQRPDNHYHQYCLKNNIKLIRINYKEDIKEKLENFLN